MGRLPPRAGLDWLKRGVALFRVQPLGLLTLFMGQLFILLLASIIPVAGQMLPVVLMPIFSISFMHACDDIEQGRRVHPRLLLTGFRKPAFPTLFRLGLLYLAAAMLALGATWLVDGGVLWQLASGQLEPNSPQVKAAPIGLAWLAAMAVYLPATMALCFGAPLISWHGMGVRKAVFYSFFAVLRALGAFLTFVLCWSFGVLLLMMLIVAILGKNDVSMLLLMSMGVMATLVLHCGFYASYRIIFATEPSAPAEKPEPRL